MKQFSHLLAVFVILVSQSAWSADTTSTASVDTELAKARELIEKKDWGSSVQALENYTRSKPDNADGFNLLGYSYRNLKRYDESLLAYEKALKLDPKHRGAHEYIGVAYIQMGQLDKAKGHLDALDKICLFSCEEYRDLKKAYEEAIKNKGK
jgi:cytochrome c-type biogenesis protein CcmH/NrfG